MNKFPKVFQLLKEMCYRHTIGQRNGPAGLYNRAVKPVDHCTGCPVQSYLPPHPAAISITVRMLSNEGNPAVKYTLRIFLFFFSNNFLIRLIMLC